MNKRTPSKVLVRDWLKREIAPQGLACRSPHRLAAQPFRHEAFDRLPDQFSPRVSERFFRLSIDEDDPAFRVNDDQCIRRYFEQALEECVRLVHECPSDKVLLE
jgi:hypothetical protein